MSFGQETLIAHAHYPLSVLSQVLTPDAPIGTRVRGPVPSRNVDHHYTNDFWTLSLPSTLSSV